MSNLDAVQVSAGGKPEDALSIEALVDLLIDRAFDASASMYRGTGAEYIHDSELLDQTKKALLERIAELKEKKDA